MCGSPFLHRHTTGRDGTERYAARFTLRLSDRDYPRGDVALYADISPPDTTTDTTDGVTLSGEEC